MGNKYIENKNLIISSYKHVRRFEKARENSFIESKLPPLTNKDKESLSKQSDEYLPKGFHGHVARVSNADFFREAKRIREERVIEERFLVNDLKYKCHHTRPFDNTSILSRNIIKAAKSLDSIKTNGRFI